MRRENIVGQYFPVGQAQEWQAIGREESELGAPSLGAAAIGLDDDPWAILASCGLGDREGGRARVQAGPVHLGATGIGGP